ncbi:type II secretion system F family protein [Propioniciclava soli]|uniref:type II secretion system F family protein n=1 Tax=Propioniciclava soli TaxID=2775081 RepID=UPI001E464A62|nr:type II secretion system F family protein [Propioniciclava soli]
MPTTLQLFLMSGLAIGTGIALLALRLIPAHPDLGNALTRLSPTVPSRATATTDTAAVAEGLTSRLGTIGMRVVPTRLWGAVPYKELRLLRRPLAVFYGQKILYALVGMATAPLLVWIFSLSFAIPLTIPVLASLGAGVAMWFVPTYDAKQEAKAARDEFNRSLSAWVDLVALERNSGSGPRQAMERAAQVGDSWVFRRLREELGRSRWSGQAPWDALDDLSDELGLPELADVADIMRLAGEEGSQVYGVLRAHSTALRDAMLATETAKANALSERVTIPGNFLVMIFMVILIGPAIFRLFTGA